MEENVEKAYNEAVESMGEIYSRTVDQLLYQVPAINNLYLGVQYSHHSWNRVRCGFITDNDKNKEYTYEKKCFIFDDYSTDDVFMHNQLW